MMRKIISVLLSLLYVIACSEPSKTTFQELQQPEIITLSASSFEIQDNDKGLFTLRWKPAKIILNTSSDVVAGPIVYTIHAAKKNTDFTPSVVLGTTSSVDSFVVKNDVLNNALQERLELLPETLNDIEFRITTSYGDPSLAQNIISPSIVLNIKTGKVPYPQNLYMIGKGIDAADWSSPNIRTLTGVHSAEHAFFTIIYIKANEWVKVNSKKEWDGKEFGKTGEMDSNNAFTIGKDNVEVTTDGIYIVYVDLKRKQIELTPAQGNILGIGDAFGGWSGVPCMVDNTAKTVTTPAATSASDLRIHATSKLAMEDNTDWWKMEFVPIDGKIEFRGRGDEQIRTTINVGQKCVMNFTTLTATIE